MSHRVGEARGTVIYVSGLWLSGTVDGVYSSSLIPSGSSADWQMQTTAHADAFASGRQR